MSKNPPSSGVIKKLVAALVGTALALLLAEVILRVADLAPDVAVIQRGRFQLSANPRLGYEPVPDLDYRGEELSFFDYKGASNRLGYRDVDHAVAKPEGTYRIVVLGDSIAAGLRIEDLEDTFASVLERQLASTGIRAEVLNFGVSGYNTEQEIETLKDKALQFDPDLVVVAYCLNDTEHVDGGILARLLDDERQDSRVGIHRANRLLVPSALYRYVRFGLFGQGAAKKIRRPPPQPPAESLAELRELAGAHDFDVLVAVFPIFRRLFRYRHSAEHDEMAEISLANGFFHLDLLPAYRECREYEEELALDPLHPNVEGHRCAGEAIARFVMREVLGKD